MFAATMVGVVTRLHGADSREVVAVAQAWAAVGLAM